MKISDVRVSISYPPFTDNPLNVPDIGLKHTEDGDTIRFKIPSQFIWMAEVMGIKLTYTTACAEYNEDDNRKVIL